MLFAKKDTEEALQVLDLVPVTTAESPYILSMLTELKLSVDDQDGALQLLSTHEECMVSWRGMVRFFCVLRDI